MEGNKPYTNAPTYPSQADYIQAGYLQQPQGYPQAQAYLPQVGYSYGPSQVPGYSCVCSPQYGVPAMQSGYLSSTFEPPPQYAYPHALGLNPAYQQAATPPAMYMPGAYDAGARFDGIAQPGILPLPPGYAANPSQMTVMQGSSTMTTQQKADWLVWRNGK